jgi:hypothetical protein
MKRDWILDVLADLRIFAVENDLPRLAEHLIDAELLAHTEICQIQRSNVNAKPLGAVHRMAGAVKNA